MFSDVSSYFDDFQRFINHLCIFLGSFITTTRGARLFYINGYTYWRGTQSNNCDVWYCSSKANKCRASVKFYSPDKEVPMVEGFHNHGQPIMVRNQDGTYHKLAAATVYQV